ncbi:MAG TPA: ABC transporter permease [Rhodopila sp.]|uniref:ABC transporter permease n=1 Tax=Rhodopila sp. TaxID=2480087 RepID=UPI002BE8667A|nr:ABC transporter permease [Rhodopila sp.]HVY13827.1 ABC transporter permease [Rhodopila sp.]
MALFAVWQVVVDVLHVRTLILPSPLSILRALADQPAWFLQEGLYTLGTTLAGFALAVAVGIVLAILIVEVRLLENTLYVLIVACNSVPKVAIAPLFVIWLGTGVGPKVAIAFLIAFFPIVIDTVLGLKSVSRDMLDLAATMHGGRLDLFWRIRLPSALPSVFAGMKVGISLALVGAIVGEFVASDHGLGYIILTAQGTFETAQIFAANLLLGVAGIVLFGIMALAERRLLPWHASQRQEA